ncbi:MAG: hypothetical protein JSS16_00930 [Proteobacteria bacterium]|uniref:hypothetical protein n=1 Tax=Rudaea sp. TaxID=2136325 RepID=UPI001DEBD187|nr:hypothetical protein [Pseudomonadota bacterium]MBS0566768.1 hypothetical protein [Pseudomonadota bacterium]
MPHTADDLPWPWIRLWYKPPRHSARRKNEPEPVAGALVDPWITILPLAAVGMVNYLFTTLIKATYGRTYEVSLVAGAKPHNGAVITLLTVCGLTHRQAYKDIFAVTCLKTLAVFVVIAAYY